MDKNLIYQDKKLHYTISGHGNTLVLLHGFVESLQIWNQYSELLSKSYQVICLDLPGFGRSDVYSDNHSMEFMADCVKAVLEEENITKCVMAGHSMGGYVSLAFAKKFPEMLSGLSLFHSHASPDNEEAKINRERTIEVVKKGKASFIQNFIPTLFAEGNAEKFSKDVKRLQEEVQNTSADGIIAALRGMKNRKGSLNLLIALEVPLQFIIGKQDPKIPYEKLLSQAALTKHAEITFLDAVGHAGFIEAEKICLQSLQNFMRFCF